MTKIIVTGSNGQLGSELKELTKNHPELSFDFTDVAELDITKEQDVLDYFTKHQFDACINCAAYTAVDKAEEERDLADLINVTGTRNLVSACKAVDATMIHVSTDFVFNGKASRPLLENDGTDPVNYYGWTKLKSEKAVSESLEKYFIIRTSWLYSTFGGNFVKTMIRLSETKDELNIIADQVGTPTYARDLAKALIALVQRNSNFGVYHYSNQGVASWYDFTSAIFEYEGIKTKVNPITTDRYPTPAKRPHYSVMDKSKFQSTFGIEIPHWRTSLKQCLEEL